MNGIDDEIKGQAIVSSVVLRKDVEETETLRDGIVRVIREEIGSIAVPKTLHVVPRAAEDAIRKSDAAGDLRREGDRRPADDRGRRSTSSVVVRGPPAMARSTYSRPGRRSLHWTIAREASDFLPCSDAAASPEPTRA